MKRLFVSLVWIMMAATNAVAQSPASIDKPDLRKGDRWVFQATDLWKNSALGRYEHLITAVNADNLELQQQIIEASEGFNWRSTKRKADRSSWTLRSGNVKEGRYVNFEFPLAVGKSWKYELVWNANGNLIPQQWEAKVEGWEEIEVPAGRFKVLKVVHAGNYQRNDGMNRSGSMRNTYWYSPEVKNFVKREYVDKLSNGQTWDQFRHELMEFSLATETLN